MLRSHPPLIRFDSVRTSETMNDGLFWQRQLGSLRFVWRIFNLIMLILLWIPIKKVVDYFQQKGVMCRACVLMIFGYQTIN